MISSPLHKDGRTVCFTECGYGIYGSLHGGIITRTIGSNHEVVPLACVRIARRNSRLYGKGCAKSSYQCAEDLEDFHCVCFDKTDAAKEAISC